MSLISQNARPKNEVNKSKREVEDDAENIDSLKMKKRKKRDGEGEQLAMEQEEDADLSEESHGHDDGRTSERKPVWVDDEEENATVNIAKVNRLRKLRKGEDENLISGLEYVSRLRAQHVKLNPGTEWARVDSKIDRCSDDETTDEENEAVVSCGYEDVDDVLRTNEDLIVKSGAKLLPGHLEYSRLVDANIQDPSNGPINSVQFHRNAQLLLAAGLDRKLRLFQIDGKRNTKFRASSLKIAPFEKRLSCQMGLRLYYPARVDRIGPLVGREEKSLEVFEVSPDSQMIAFTGNEGYILLVSTKQSNWLVL
ncbi:U3 small nucleolar RNA-associated protein 18-like [Spatholobus suberectus]|nr:U3 small nucleolar RNA-associated protein 18-like [Spatholobus suberectus]